MDELDNFNVILLGVIFDPSERKILIGKRNSDPYVSKLGWVFPGGRFNKAEDMEEALKKRIKEKTGLEVENLGTIFSRVFNEKSDFLLIYYLCETMGGEEKAQRGFSELKWVSPEDLEKHFTTSFHPHLKEYILNLK